MENNQNFQSLKERLDSKEIIVAPGIYDALSGLFVQQAGFETVYLSGASLAYTRYGRPDIGLIGMREVEQRHALLHTQLPGLHTNFPKKRRF